MFNILFNHYKQRVFKPSSYFKLNLWSYTQLLEYKLNLSTTITHLILSTKRLKYKHIRTFYVLNFIKNKVTFIMFIFITSVIFVLQLYSIF